MTGVGIHDENTAFPVFSLIHHSSSLSISTWPSLFCIRSHVKHQESTVLALTCRTGCLRTWQYQVDVVIGPETRWEAQCVRGKVYCQSDSALSSRSLAVYLFPWQGNGSVTHSQTVGVSLFSWEATSIYTAFQLTASVAGAVPSASQWLSEATKERGWGLAGWLAGVTVNDRSQSIYLLTESQLVQGMLFLERKKKGDRGKLAWERQKGQVGKGEDTQAGMGSERWEDKEKKVRTAMCRQQQWRRREKR